MPPSTPSTHNFSLNSVLFGSRSTSDLPSTLGPSAYRARPAATTTALDNIGEETADDDTITALPPPTTTKPSKEAKKEKKAAADAAKTSKPAAKSTWKKSVDSFKKLFKGLRRRKAVEMKEPEHVMVIGEPTGFRHVATGGAHGLRTQSGRLVRREDSGGSLGGESVWEDVDE